MTSAIDSVAWARTSAVKTVPGKKQFIAEANFTMTRFDDTALPVQFNDIIVHLNFELRDAVTDAIVPLKADQFTTLVPMASYVFPQVGNPLPSVATSMATLNIEPTDATQLDSVDRTYKLIVAIDHVDAPGQRPVSGNSVTNAAQRLLHFNGTLLFGAIETTFTSLAADPPFIGTVANGVRSTLGINSQSGYLVNKPDHTFGDGTALNVVLRPNGNAEYVGVTPVALNGPSPDGGTIGRVRFNRASVVLDASGAKGTVLAFLPAGFGFRFDLNGRVLHSTATFFGVSLDQELQPAVNPALNGPLFACEETKPLWVVASSMLWMVQKGEFVLDATGVFYVRRHELDALEAAPGLVGADMHQKRSNEQYFRHAFGAGAQGFTVLADSQSNAVMSGEFAIGPGTNTTHFPYDSTVGWSGAGKMVISNDLVVPSSSYLAQAPLVGVKYGRDCIEPSCLPMAGTIEVPLLPTNSELHFTIDGGLHASGELFPGRKLTWGWIGPPVADYAHQTDPFVAASLHVPGCFLRGDQHSPSVELKPAALLLTGVVASNLFQVERPDTPAYLAKDVGGDYAGLNLVVGMDAALQGQSVLAARPIGKYDLPGRCKYYIRWWGVSGIHEAVPGTFKPDAELYNYKFNITQFGLSFLGNENIQSRTAGQIVLPWPSGFTQNFKELTFLCNGALDDAKVPSDEADLMKLLQYWNGDFITQGIHFEHDPNLDCDPSQGFLVLGVKAFASNFDVPLYGDLGVQTNGNLITPAFAAANNLSVNSRLQTENNVQLLGPKIAKGMPEREVSTFTPVTEAYYNNFDFFPSPDEPQGFINCAGRASVRFFEDLRTHLHTGGQSNLLVNNLFFMGGWEKPGVGWEDDQGHHYFNDTGFDPDHRGWDPAVSVPAQYRKQGVDDQTEKHLVRARRKWLNVVDLDYPLHWDVTGRAFASKNLSVEDDLLILHASHEVKYLSAEQTKLAFGIQYSGVPVVDIATLPIADLISDGLGQDIIDDLTAISEGLEALNALLDDDMHDFFAAPFEATLPETVAHLHFSLTNAFHNHVFNPAATTIISQHCLDNVNYGASFEKKFIDMLGQFQTVGVIKEIYDKLGLATNSLGRVHKLLMKDPGTGKRDFSQLVGKGAPASIKDKLDQLEKAVEDADISLEGIDEVVQELYANLAFIRGTLAPAAEFAAELTQVVTTLKNSGVIHNLALAAATKLNIYIASLDLSVDDPGQVFDPMKFKKKVRQVVEDEFFSSALPTAIQATLKQRLYDKDSEIRMAIDSMFATGNTIIRELVALALADVSEDFAPGLNKLAGAMQAARLNGSAHIKGDSLKFLRLDAKARLNLGAQLQFDAFFQLKELDSTGSDEKCGLASGSWTEVSMGALHVKLGWISPKLIAGVQGKFSFANPSGTLLNLMGALDVSGGITFEAFKLKEIGFAIAMGEFENYGAAKVRAEFNKKEMAAGFFAGKACDKTPLELVNKNFASAIGNPSPFVFTGMYGYAEGWYPLNEILGIPSTCWLNLRGGAGIGVFVNLGGADPVFGGQYHYGVSGEVLCIVEVQGELDLIGAKQGDDYTFKGTGTLSGEIGVCPFCKDFSKSIGVTCHVHLDVSPDGISDTDVDWDVDF